MEETEKKEDICCPKYNPEPWDGKTIEWKDKLFIKDSMRTFFHIPNPSSIAKVMTNLQTKSEQAKAVPEMKDWLILSNDPSAFRSDYYYAVTKEVPGIENVKISGKFFTKVFDGPYGSVPKWIKEVEMTLGKDNTKVKNYYFYYTTCPKCAKKYGHNYVVVFAQIG